MIVLVKFFRESSNVKSNGNEGLIVYYYFNLESFPVNAVDILHLMNLSTLWACFLNCVHVIP